MFSIPRHSITLPQAAILMDDGLFRGIPSWGRCVEYIKPKYILNPMPEEVKVHQTVEWLLNGGAVHVSDETAREDRDTIYLFDMKGLARGLDLFIKWDTAKYKNMLLIFSIGLDKATDLTVYGNAVIQLGIFGEIKHGL